MRGEPVFDVGDAIPGERRDHEGRGERDALVGCLGDGKQGRLVDQIDLVDHQDFGLADLGEPRKDRVRLVVEAARGIDQHSDDIGVVRPCPGVRHHGAIEPALRREDAGRIDEDELRAARDGDAAQQRARRLHLVGDDRDLAADERVDQRRFADIGRADERDEAAAGWRRLAWRRTRDQLQETPLPREASRLSDPAPAGRGVYAQPSSAARIDARARQHGGRGRLLRRALRAAKPFRRRKVGKLDGDAEFRIVVGTLALDLPIGRRRQAARLRPFLQHGLGIAQRPRRRAHALAPQPLDQGGRRRISAIDEHRSDQRLADIGEDGGAAAPAGIGLRSAKPDRRAELDRPRHVRARFLAHEVGKTARHFSFISLWERAKQHVGDHEAEHVIAEKLKPLIGAGAVAQRRSARKYE